MTPREKADRAKQVLEDPVFRSVFDDIRQDFVRKLEECPLGDIETQHEIALSLQLLKRIRVQLERYVDEIAVDKAKERHDNWIRKVQQKLTV
jgi:hypothetical protein